MAGAGAGSKKSALFICLGNICRSPIAEAVFLDLLETKEQRDQWHVDSAAIGDWHVGGPPDKRTMKTLKKKGVTNYKHVVRQINVEDFHKFDVIFGMDKQNMRDLEDIQPKGSKAVLEMLGTYDPNGKIIIDDPYYGSRIEDFEEVYDQVVRCCEAYLKSLEGKTS
ncbi:low molecular weight phosphotyrosine protein phosphatase-like [Mizuhopecten yessoensis]|uniref:Low molecular weight phosphotyrosine protein phosphatase n=1 Tax=Mizuhopecten yessoensis TaxID=6573 RepID=A0A210QUH5_MIZYE|nr:low molecular weight phosphotyrosine protein phosphatase-like [Mizuhopecten yessoensis]OWF52385.1 Low molecular weight phosphotyrosine protein phosphatase [Mizuhopecten yessoensis]